MKLRSLFESRTIKLGVTVSPADFKRIMKEGETNFNFKYLEDNTFVISLNLSVGSNLFFDVTPANTKSSIIFYGNLHETEGSGTEIRLRSRSRHFSAALLIVMPVLVVCFQMIFKMEPVKFFVVLMIFPLVIYGTLNFIRSEEGQLLRLFKEHLNNQIIKHYNHT